MPITTAQRDKLEKLFDTSVDVPGYSKCYVRGCYVNATIGRLHKIYGGVDTCRDHDPEKHGYALGFGFGAQPSDVVPDQVVPAAAEEPQLTKEQIIAQMIIEVIRMSLDDGRPDGGKKAKLVPPKKPLSPQGVGLRVPDPNAVAPARRF